MYNGIGLTTARGSGTNGYVQKNLSFVRTHKEKVEYKPDEEAKKLEQLINRKGNSEILAHEKKRQIEVKCAEMEDMLTEQGYTEVELNFKVSEFRKMLLKTYENEAKKFYIEYDEFGKPM